MIGTTELLVILAVAVVLFGPERLPELAGVLGKAVREFREALGGDGGKKLGG